MLKKSRIFQTVTEWCNVENEAQSIQKVRTCTAWKVSKYGAMSGPYFPVCGLNTGKYGPEITPYLVTFHAVLSYDKVEAL